MPIIPTGSSNPVAVAGGYANLPTASNVLGGPYNGYSPQQTLSNYKGSDSAMVRRILRVGWNTQNASGTVNGRQRVITPFRAVNNAGDFLARRSYICGGPTPNTLYHGGVSVKGRFGSLISRCDGTGVPAASANGRFVADSSDYTTFRKQMAMNHNYNDVKNGGDKNNGSYVARMAVNNSRFGIPGR
jgi:hypothetical protein